MGVYIKGMEMPPACNRCWNCDINTVDGTETEPPYACLIRMKFVEEEWEHKRPDWCPLIEVPTPHGRLIDADALKLTAFAYSNNFIHKMMVFGGQMVYSESAIDNAPTIIESEEMNG